MENSAGGTSVSTGSASGLDFKVYVAGRIGELERLDVNRRSILEDILSRMDVKIDQGLIILGHEYHPIPRDLDDMPTAIELLLTRQGYADKLSYSVFGDVLYLVSSWVKEYVRMHRPPNFLDIPEEEVKVSEKERLYYSIVKTVMARHIIKTFYTRSSESESVIGMHCFNGVVYEPCEQEVKREIETLAASEPVDMKLTRWVIGEALDKIKRKTLTRLHYEPLKIAFKNRVILDWERFLRTGRIREAIISPDPDVVVFHLIPHRLATEKLYELDGLARFDEGLMVNLEELAEKLCPKSLAAFKSWVGDMWLLLFEIIGYTLYPRYDLHKAIMLVGEGANGKSTYLRLVREILGRHNIASVSLQELTDDRNHRFSPVELYHRLANIYADLPSNAITSSGRFKLLTGEDYITAERKFRDPIKFVNYAKLLFSANELPSVNDLTPAFWRRWIVVEFKNRFKPNPRFYEETFTEEEVEGVIIVSLLAFRNAWVRGEFSFQDSEDNAKEKWMRRANSVYAFVKDLLAGNIEGVQGVREPNARVQTGDLYELYVKYCEEEERNAVSKARFTKELQRLGFKTMKIGHNKYYVGIRLIREESLGISDNPLAGRGLFGRTGEE